MILDFKQLLIKLLDVDFRYPVGSYYETSNSVFDPNTAWGGAWTLISTTANIYKWHRTS